MLNSDELLRVFGQVKEIGKRTGLLFREITNQQRQNAAEAVARGKLDKQVYLARQTNQAVIDIMEDVAEMIDDAKLQLFWRLCTLRIPHPKEPSIYWEYKENVTSLVAFKITGEELHIAGCSLYSISDGLDKQGYPYLLPIRLGTMIAQKKIAEIDMLCCAESDWKNLLLQTVIRSVCTKNGLSNGTEMVLFASVKSFSSSEKTILTEIGFQKLPSTAQEVFILQDLHDLHLVQATPSSLRSAKTLQYCPADETSVFGPCE